MSTPPPSPSVAALVETIARMQREIDQLKRSTRTPQLPHSALGPGQFIAIVDDGGRTSGRIGYQPDGGIGLIPEPGTGDPPPTPSAPLLTPSVAGLRIVWDGRLLTDSEEEAVRPSDLAHVAVEITTGDTEWVRVGSITRAGDGGMLPVVPLAYVEHTVRLVAVTTSAVEGPPSATAAATPVQVEGPDLAAAAVIAGHISAGAVEADKLSAILALVTRIVAGDPNGARVELNPDGFRAYSAAGALTVAVDSETGDGVFTGIITGAEIVGSRMTIGTPPGATGVITSAPGPTGQDVAYMRVTAPGRERAQLAATQGQAEFTAWTDYQDAHNPAGGLTSQPDGVRLAMYSDVGEPADAPRVVLVAAEGTAETVWASGTGAAVAVRALLGHTTLSLAPPRATDPDDAQSSGIIYGHRVSGGDIAAVSIQGPIWQTDTGPEYLRRALLFVEGARPERPYTRMLYQARRHLFGGEAAAGGYDTSDGVVDLAPTHTIHAPRHATVRGTLQAQLISFSTGTNFFDFPAGVFPTFSFKTGWSGRVEFIVQMAGLNAASAASSIALGFRLSGHGTLAADLTRCAFVRSIGAGVGSSQRDSALVRLTLAPNAEYTVHPCYRITSGTVAFFDLALDNSISVTPLI